MSFKENKIFNSLTPEDIYTVSKEVKDTINKLLEGNLSSIAFDKSILLEILNYLNSKK
jgi:hypothetical protein